MTEIFVDDFNDEVKLVKLVSKKLEVHLLSLGATIHKVIYPGDEGDSGRDVILGFDTAAGYDGTGNPFFWGTTGRFTNRVKNGKFELDGVEHQLSKNDFGNKLRHHLHGGKKSYDRILWNTHVLDSKDGVTFSVLDPHGSEGYPGNVLTHVTYRLANGCHLDIKMTSVTDTSTIINVSNHVYFNLAGHGSGWTGLQQHKLTVVADNFTPDDQEYLPTGEIKSVEGTEYDFRKPKLLSESVVSARQGEGYCVNFCVGDNHNQLSHVATLEHELSKRKLEVWSDQPGLELYTGNFLPSGTDKDGPLKGKDGSYYTRWGGVCLMTQNYRDAANHQNFPPATLEPGETYTHNVSYRFL